MCDKSFAYCNTHTHEYVHIKHHSKCAFNHNIIVYGRNDSMLLIGNLTLVASAKLSLPILLLSTQSFVCGINTIIIIIVQSTNYSHS